MTDQQTESEKDMSKPTDHDDHDYAAAAARERIAKLADQRARIQAIAESHVVRPSDDDRTQIVDLGHGVQLRGRASHGWEWLAERSWDSIDREGRAGQADSYNGTDPDDVRSENAVHNTPDATTVARYSR